VIDPSCEQSRKQCEEFVDKFITCSKDESLGTAMNRQFHKHQKTCQKKKKGGEDSCRFDFPRYPMRKTRILSRLDSTFSREDVKKYKAIHKQIVAATKDIASTDENCSFGEYLGKLRLTENDYILALRSNLRGHKVFYQRDLRERFLNVYNRDILSLWDANMDLQFILDPYATISYVNDYLTKSNVVASRLLRSLQEKFKKGDLDLMNKIRQIVNTFINNSDITAQEVCLHLLGMAMHRSSVAQVFINTSPFEKRVQLLKSESDLEVLHDIDPDSQDIFVRNLSCRYIQRPGILESVCLSDFAAMYTFPKKKSEKKQNEDRNSEEEVGFSENEEKKNTSTQYGDIAAQFNIER